MAAGVRRLSSGRAAVTGFLCAESFFLLYYRPVLFGSMVGPESAGTFCRAHNRNTDKAWQKNLFS